MTARANNTKRFRSGSEGFVQVPAHNPKVVGSNPTPATMKSIVKRPPEPYRSGGLFLVLLFFC